MSNKPDNVADNPGLLPYASNVGAPSIKVSNIEHWKEPRIINLNQQFENKFLELNCNIEISVRKSKALEVLNAFNSVYGIKIKEL